MAGIVDKADTVQNSGWCWFWIVIRIADFILIALVSIRIWIRSPWAIIGALVPVISDIVIAESTVEERFSDRLFPRKELFGAVWVKLFPIPDGWGIRSSSEYMDPVRRAYEIIIFPKLMTDVHNLVVEVIPRHLRKPLPLQSLSFHSGYKRNYHPTLWPNH